MLDKENILNLIEKKKIVSIELGCGNNKKHSNTIGIDAIDYADVDIVGDVYKILALFPSQSVDTVYSYHFVEHIPDVETLLSELFRIIKADGYVEFVAPHFSNPYFYSDPTHCKFFGLYTFCYYANTSFFSRKVPTYNHKVYFDTIKVDLIFKSTKPFFFRYSFKRIIGYLFNSCTYFKEFYEENLCYLFPCYEVRYILRPLKPNK